MKPPELVLIQSLEAYANDSNYRGNKVKHCVSECSRELLKKVLNKTPEQAIKTLAKSVDQIIISTESGDSINAFTILKLGAGKRHPEVIARSTLGALSVDVYKYFADNFPDCYVHFSL